MNNYIYRQDLIDLLCKGRDFPLTLSIAAAGSGKSVLLEQWREYLAEHEPSTQVLFFNILTRHNDGNILFAQIFDAVKTITQLWDEPYFNMFKDDSHVDTDQFIIVFCQALEQLNFPLVIVFDDFHNITSQHIHHVVEKLICNLPPHVTLTISSRYYPAISVTKMKIAGNVLSIDSNDFKLSETDINKLNKTIGAPKLNTDQVFALLQQTEGWFVGTKLALLAFDKRDDYSQNEFSGSHSELLDYFGQEVIHRLSPSLKNFILSITICESFNQELCESVLELDYASARLEEGRMQELFLTPDPDKNGWYRYHPILREFLLRILEKEKGADYIQGLHFKVAEFFLNHAEYSKAIYHARHSKNQQYYLSVLQITCSSWFKEGDLEPIIEELEKLSDDDFQKNTELLVYKLYALCFTRRFNQAAYYLDILTASENASSEETLKCYSAFFERLLKVFQNDAEIQKDKPKRVTSHPSAPPELEAFNMVVDAYILMCNGQLNSGFKAAYHAQERLYQLSHKFFDSYATSVIILCDRYLGRGIEAIQHMYKVFTPIRDGKRTPRWVNLATGMMVVQYEQNLLDQAQLLGTQLVPLVNQAFATEVVTMVYLHSSRMMHINGQISKAGRLLDQLQRILSLGEHHRFNSQVVHEKMRQAFCNANKSNLDSMYEQYQLEQYIHKRDWQPSQNYEERRERLALAAVYWLISKGRFKQATELLDDIANILDFHGIKSRALIARCNQVLILFRQGNVVSAVSMLKKLIGSYGLVCFSRGVFDEAPGLDAVFQAGLDGNSLILPDLFIDTFKSLLDTKALSYSAPKNILTDKEFEIFELLSSGLSNEAISKQSGIALSTAKWHLKNIYNKLGVSNRAEAIHVALRKDVVN